MDAVELKNLCTAPAFAALVMRGEAREDGENLALALAGRLKEFCRTHALDANDSSAAYQQKLGDGENIQSIGDAA